MKTGITFGNLNLPPIVPPKERPPHGKHDGPGRPRRYDWEKLFREDWFIMFKYLDYDCDSKSMIQQIKNAASSRKLKIKYQLQITHDEVEYIEVDVDHPDDLK